jgi:hypothetical protein
VVGTLPALVGAVTAGAAVDAVGSAVTGLVAGVGGATGTVIGDGTCCAVAVVVDVADVVATVM